MKKVLVIIKPATKDATLDMLKMLLGENDYFCATNQDEAMRLLQEGDYAVAIIAGRDFGQLDLNPMLGLVKKVEERDRSLFDKILVWTFDQDFWTECKLRGLSAYMKANTQSEREFKRAFDALVG